MERKFGGVGLANAFILGLFTILLIVGLKIMMTKKPVPGVTEIVQAV